jgi:molybdopterin molybdotransferase
VAGQHATGKATDLRQLCTFPFIGLPGNPVSAYMGFEIFVRPVLMKLQGRLSWQRPMIQVEIEEVNRVGWA